MPIEDTRLDKSLLGASRTRGRFRGPRLYLPPSEWVVAGLDSGAALSDSGGDPRDVSEAGEEGDRTCCEAIGGFSVVGDGAERNTDKKRERAKYQLSIMTIPPKDLEEEKGAHPSPSGRGSSAPYCVLSQPSDLQNGSPLGVPTPPSYRQAGLFRVLRSKF